MNLPVIYIIQVNRLVVNGGPMPLKKERIRIVAGQVCDSRGIGASYICLNHNRLRWVTFMLPGEGFEPQLVFQIWFYCRNVRK